MEKTKMMIIVFGILVRKHQTPVWTMKLTIACQKSSKEHIVIKPTEKRQANEEFKLIKGLTKSIAKRNLLAQMKPSWLLCHINFVWNWLTCKALSAISYQWHIVSVSNRRTNLKSQHWHKSTNTCPINIIFSHNTICYISNQMMVISPTICHPREKVDVTLLLKLWDTCGPHLTSNNPSQLSLILVRTKLTGVIQIRWWTHLKTNDLLQFLIIQLKLHVIYTWILGRVCLNTTKKCSVTCFWICFP